MQATELARPIQDPQTLDTALARAATVFLLSREEDRAEALLDELLERLQGRPQLGFVAVEAHNVAWIALTLGRAPDMLAVLEHEPFQSPWVRAGRAVASNDLVAAADMFGAIRALPLEAFYRLRAAERLVSEERRAEADLQLRQSLTFYRSVGAAPFVREGEALLAAAI